MGSENSLRMLIHKWLLLSSASTVLVTRSSRNENNVRRYVRVDAVGPKGPIALYFFQHDDGEWRIFPPSTSRQTLCACVSDA
jgi:hypothetical protein